MPIPICSFHLVLFCKDIRRRLPCIRSHRNFCPAYSATRTGDWFCQYRHGRSAGRAA